MTDPSIQPDELVTNSDLLKQFLELWKMAPSPKGEAAAWIVRITVPELTYKLINRKTNADSHVNLGNCHPSAIAQVHTHYHGLDPKPSTWGDQDKHDWYTATRCKVPVYVLSSFAIWKVLPGGKTPTLIKVANKWF